MNVWNSAIYKALHCVKSVRIRSFSGLYFPAFGLNAEIYRVNLSIHSECGKIRTSKTPNRNIFHAVLQILYNPVSNPQLFGNFLEGSENKWIMGIFKLKFFQLLHSHLDSATAFILMKSFFIFIRWASFTNFQILNLNACDVAKSCWTALCWSRFEWVACAIEDARELIQNPWDLLQISSNSKIYFINIY